MSNAVWKLTNEEYEFIKGEVVHLFELYNVRCIPVSGFEIALKMKICLIPYSALSEKQLKEALEADADGFTAVKDGRECIFYNNIDKSYKRQNFTILHEIGHIALDHTGASEFRDKEEDEADFFAKYAIAPPVLVHKIGATCPEDIYEHFDIGYEASYYAYEYYLTWEYRYERIKRLTSYEVKILELSEKGA